MFIILTPIDLFCVVKINILIILGCPVRADFEGKLKRK